MPTDFFGNAVNQVTGAFNSGFNAVADKQAMQDAVTKALGAISTEQTRQFDLNYEQAKKKIDNDYQIAMRNAKTAQEAQEATRRYNEQQLRLAEQRLQLDSELGRGNLGLNYLSQASQLRGPADWAQYSDFMRGASQRQDVPVFVQALMNNQRMPAFQAAGGQPTPVSASSMLAQLTGQGGDGAPVANGQSQDEMAFNAIKGIGAAGANKLGGGALEQLLPEEMQMLQSGLERGGYSAPGFLAQYQRSRVNNRTADASRA